MILPLGLIVLLGMGVYWVYEKIASPKEEKVIIQQVPQEPQSIIPDVFIAPAEKIWLCKSRSNDSSNASFLSL